MNAVMVVEDEQVIAEDIADTLATMGYAVTGTVSSGEECVEVAGTCRPDLVLMDINLGGEMDGIRAAQVLKERFDVPVVFLSAHADDRTLRRAKLTGPLGYLVKPFRRSELKSAVEVGLFRHRLERQLKDRERWLSTTLRAIGDAVIAVDAQGRISFMNGAAEALLGRSEASAQGAQFASLVRLLNEKTREPIEDLVQVALARQEVVRAPACTSLIGARGEIPIEQCAAPICDERGHRLGAVVVLRDVTEQRRAQEHIVVADRLVALGAVAAGVAHEINNPLTYILANLQFMTESLEGLRPLLDTWRGDERAQRVGEVLRDVTEMLHDVKDGAGRVSRIVADLGFFGRRRAPTRRGAPVRALEWALRVTRTAVGPHVRVSTRLSPVPDVACDDGALGQIFVNLLLNAGYAMQGGGAAAASELSVTTELEAPPEPRFVRVTVRDTGCGMSPDVLERIFDPFFTTKPVGAGSGLGLSVCHGLVEAVGGQIQATSAPGRGATFVVRLPVAEAAKPGDSAKPAAARARARVLLIDDDPRVLSALGRLLSPVHEVVTCDGARGALGLLHESSAFDAIVCDVLMPEMTGMELYERLRAAQPELARRVIFLSGGARTEKVLDFFRGVPNLLLHKPPSASELFDAIERERARSPCLAAGAGAVDRSTP